MDEMPKPGRCMQSQKAWQETELIPYRRPVQMLCGSEFAQLVMRCWPTSAVSCIAAFQERGGGRRMGEGRGGKEGVELLLVTFIIKVNPTTEKHRATPGQCRNVRLRAE